MSMNVDLKWLDDHASKVEYDWPNDTVALTLNNGDVIVCPTLEECVQVARRGNPEWRAGK